MSRYQTILKRYWGYDSFRSIQQDIIESIGSGRDTLGLMPTGGGKSITFQVPALAMEGTCIVVTPLIALMKDQVARLRRLGIMADAVYSGMQHADILRVLDNCILGSTKLLYVSPERLGSQLFQTKMRHMRVSFITVDEAHCISQWGYDFRPSYLKICEIRSLCPQAPVLALTATATPRVVEDICRRLSRVENDHSDGCTAPGDEPSASGFAIFRTSFERKNLTYIVRRCNDKDEELARTLRDTPGAAIVYVRSRRRAADIAKLLSERGLSATFYHAGLEHTVKDARQDAWQHDEVRIMVATNAFGMGIDKPDVRLVMHYDCPDSIEAYFQEAGRGGRDGQPAEAVLLFNSADRGKLQRRVAETFPPKDYVKTVYEHLAYYYQIAVGDGFGVSREFSLDEFCMRFRHFPVPVHSSLQILSRAGYIEYDEETDNEARVRFLVGRDDLYRLRQLSPREDKVIVALLRCYGGLFADYGFIDESMVARQAGLTPPETYDVLTGLSRRHLLDFIPRKRVPYIRYLQRREDTEHVQLSREVYDDRREQYEQRIVSMIRYAECDDCCRSRQLLAYFGEHAAQDCGRCDVCLEQSSVQQPCGDDMQGGQRPADAEGQAELQLLNLLADGRRHHVTDLLALRLPSQQIDKALSRLMAEERIVQEDGFLHLQ